MLRRGAAAGGHRLIGFPVPSRGNARIGELLPNCTIPSWQMDDFVTAVEAIGDLPPVEAGKEVTHYEGPRGAVPGADASGT